MMLPDISKSVWIGSGGDRVIDTSLVDYVDILFNLMGIDMTYDRFQLMSEGERKQFVRDIKIKRVLD